MFPLRDIAAALERQDMFGCDVMHYVVSGLLHISHSNIFDCHSIKYHQQYSVNVVNNFLQFYVPNELIIIWSENTEEAIKARKKSKGNC